MSSFDDIVTKGCLHDEINTNYNITYETKLYSIFLMESYKTVFLFSQA